MHSEELRSTAKIFYELRDSYATIATKLDLSMEAGPSRVSYKIKKLKKKSWA